MKCPRNRGPLGFPWEKFKADFEGWHADVQTIIDAADREGCYRWSLHYRPAIRNWSTARATLLGDAVHPTLPYLAQGACMAIEDGAVLARALDQADSIPDALQLYQRNRVDRTVRIVDQSTAKRTLFHLRTVDEIRASFAKRDEGADRNAWRYSYNPLTVKLVLNSAVADITPVTPLQPIYPSARGPPRRAAERTRRHPYPPGV